jgi:hypothetical protein
MWPNYVPIHVYGVKSWTAKAISQEKWNVSLPHLQFATAFPTQASKRA